MMMIMITRRSLQSLKCFSACIIVIFVGGCILALKSITNEESRKDDDFKRRAIVKESLEILQLDSVRVKQESVNETRKHKSNDPIVPNLHAMHGKKLVVMPDVYNSTAFPPPNYNIHAFYYPWYGNPQFDGQYVHWDHPRLPHWDKNIARKFSTERHLPPDDIGASFYPKLGCYSSKDPHVIEIHMQQLRAAGIGVLALSWYPPGKSDDSGIPRNGLVQALLDACYKYKIKLAFHSEPYKNRSEVTFLKDLKYIIDTYGSHPAIYRYQHDGVDLPLVYLYDSYLTPAMSWAHIFKKNGPLSIRGTKYDAFIVGLFVEQKHGNDLLKGGFNGFYTYFAANKFTYASRWRNWKVLAEFSRRNNMIFIPSVGPGYDDTMVRPWNSVNTHSRRDGAYYKEAFTAAMNNAPAIISITSYNEWHEGTQIESAVPRPNGHMKYSDYLPNDPNFYLTISRQMVDKFKNLNE